MNKENIARNITLASTNGHVTIGLIKRCQTTSPSDTDPFVILDGVKKRIAWHRI